MICVVQKPFEGPQGLLASGTVVDSSAWRNEGRLLNTRYIRAATAAEAAAVGSAPGDRQPAAAGATPGRGRRGPKRVH